MSASCILRLEDVAVHYGGVRAVDGVSLSLTPSQIYGVIGPNGSGKSTLLAAITRLAPLTRGKIEFKGKLLNGSTSLVAREGMSRTFQTVRLLPQMSVHENVQLGADLGSARGLLTRGESKLRVAGALERVGLKGLGNARPDELSYGTQRRVEIARAIVGRPVLLLLDEPTAGMNGRERSEISALLKSLRSEGLSQILIEHDVQMMHDTCDYLYAMSAGKVIAEGPPTMVVRDPLVQEAYLGRSIDGA
jgi:branched-chain amino acid transport system ATP-binding protein